VRWGARATSPALGGSATPTGSERPQRRHRRFCVQDRRRLPWQILEAAGLDQRLVKLTALLVAISDSGG
jgi:hypothetical protein